jgi:alkylation response protein AidB-like acyl-CoA dehydrogenase
MNSRLPLPRTDQEQDSGEAGIGIEAGSENGIENAIEAATESLAAALAQSAVARDRAGGHAAAERALIRQSGLLGLVIPRAFGGLGADWPTLYRTVRRLAQADSALAHVFGFHHLQIAGVLFYGDAAQQQRLLGQTVREQLFWANALNPLDRRLIASPVEGGWRLDGTKSFASGSVGSDRLTVMAVTAEAAEGAPGVLIGSLPTRSPGISVSEDWDGFGQRQTDSGTVQFTGAFLPANDVLQAPSAKPTVRQTFRTLVSQLIMTNLYLGIAIGAFEAARAFTRNASRPWFASGVASAAEDPHIQRRYGDLWLYIRAATPLADLAAVSLAEALDRGEAVTAAERGVTAIAVAEAKVLAHRAAIEISSQLFELTGARATSASLGLDRFWRNARVHTLHDPVDYKLCEIGRHTLGGGWPEPTPYS